jgi:hypothetical protein
MQFEIQRQWHVRSRLCRAAVSLMAVLMFGHSAHARDLSKTDPDRKLILDGARGQDNVKLIVKDLFKDGDFALLCALKQEPGGGITGTDDMLDVSEWVLIRDSGRWLVHDTGAGFAHDVSTAACANAPTSKAGIIDALLRSVRWGLFDDVIMRRSLDEYSPVLQLLERKGHAAGVPMDEENELPAFRITGMLEACKKNDKCKAETRRIFARAEVLRKSEQVNALAWRFCDRTSDRKYDAPKLGRCLETAAKEPACRTGLSIPRDKQTLDQCIATLSSSTPLD